MRGLPVIALLLSCAAAFGADSTSQIGAAGTFRPAGPPEQQPIRVDAGRACVVDIRQPYLVKGTLSGSFEIDYRILVLGPCGRPRGTFDEEWIARGKFVGSLNGRSTTADFTYTATVESGGEIRGLIALGHGLDGELRVRGSLSDGELTYDGKLTAPSQEEE